MSVFPSPSLAAISKCTLYLTFIFFNFLNKLIYLFIIFGCVRASLLHAGSSLVAASGGLLFVALRGLLIAVASLVVEHRL